MQPLDLTGAADPAGSVVVLAIGMAPLSQDLTSLAQLDPTVSDALVFADGGAAGQTADAWIDSSQNNYDRVRDSVLAPAGLSEAQVQVVWLTQGNADPLVGLPDPSADAFTLLANLADIVRAIHIRYPNVQMVLLSNRVYAGYATSTLNPEPYAYESGLAVKWLIEAQISQNLGQGIDPTAGDLAWFSSAPWLGWGPDLWADGTTPRLDGLFWQCDDLASDGTALSPQGELKLGQQLFDFAGTSPFTAPWFLQ